MPKLSVLISSVSIDGLKLVILSMDFLLYARGLMMDFPLVFVPSLVEVLNLKIPVKLNI